jgi:hypothetical protein
MFPDQLRQMAEEHMRGAMNARQRALQVPADRALFEIGLAELWELLAGRLSDLAASQEHVALPSAQHAAAR